MSRRLVAAGLMTRPTRCTLTVSPETLRAARFPDQAAAHAAGRCARLWAAERKHTTSTASTPLAVLLAAEAVR